MCGGAYLLQIKWLESGMKFYHPKVMWLWAVIWWVSWVRTPLAAMNVTVLLYRLRINYRRISLRRNLSRKCRKMVKFVSITHSERNIWNGPIVATAISRKKREPVLEGKWLHLATPVTRPDSVWYLPVVLRQGHCLRPIASKDTTRIATAH